MSQPLLAQKQKSISTLNMSALGGKEDILIRIEPCRKFRSRPNSALDTGIGQML
jgi:hypothetical protein